MFPGKPFNDWSRGVISLGVLGFPALERCFATVRSHREEPPCDGQSEPIKVPHRKTPHRMAPDQTALLEILAELQNTHLTDRICFAPKRSTKNSSTRKRPCTLVLTQASPRRKCSGFAWIWTLKSPRSATVTWVTPGTVGVLRHHLLQIPRHLPSDGRRRRRRLRRAPRGPRYRSR